MATNQDNFADTSKLNELIGSEVTGGTLINEDIQSGNILDFDGSGDYVASPRLQNTFNDDFTISIWAKTDNLSQSSKWLFGADNLGTNGVNRDQVGMRVSNQDILFNFQADEAGGNMNITDAVPDTDWHMYSFTAKQNGANVDFVAYRDGVEIGSTSDAGTLSDYDNTNSETPYIGTRNLNGSVESAYFTGQLSQFLVYKEAMSASEVFDLYTHGDVPNTATLETYLKLDEGTGTTATDSSTNSNDGTITGTTWISGSIFTTQSRTTSDNLLSEESTLQNFKYTTAKKPADTNGRVQFSTDYDTQRENVLSFDGSTTFAESVTFPDLQGGDITLLARVKYDDFSVAPTVISNGSGAGSTYYAMRTSTIGEVLFTTTGTGGGTITSNQQLELSVWYDIAVVLDSGTSKAIYINGVQDNLDTASAYTVVGNAAGIRIGEFSNSFPLLMSGNIAEARVYSRALSTSELLAFHETNTIPATTDLEGEWVLNEGSGSTATDTSPNGNDLTITSGTWETDTDFAHSIANWVNKDGSDIGDFGAYEFDGVDDRITILTSLANGQEEVMMAWIKTTETSNNWLMADANSSFSDMRRGLYVKDGTFNGWVFDGTGKSLDSGVIVNDGKWHHVAQSINLNTSTRKLYVDGVLRASDSNLDTVNNYNDFVIGGSGTGGSFFTGLISDARIYSEEILESDFWNLYAYSTEPDNTNLEGHWKMNGNALDSSSNGNDGTVDGAINTTDWNELLQTGFSMLGADTRDVLSFDGSNDYASLPDITTLDGLSDVTFKAYVKYTSNAARQAIITKHEASSNQRSFFYSIESDGTLRILLYKDGGSTNYIFCKSTGTVPEGVWVLVEGTWSGGSSFTFKINGQDIGAQTSVTNGTAPTVIHNSASIAVIGAAKYSSSPFDTNFNGEIAAVELLDGATTVNNWQLDEGTGTSVVDSTGSDDGTITGATWITDAVSNVYETAKFDGVDDYIDVADDSSLDFTGDMTVCAWIKTNTPSSNEEIAGKYDAISLRGWILLTRATGKLRFDTRDGGAYETGTESNSVVTDGEWHFVVGRRSGSTKNIWIDGVLEATDTVGTGSYANSLTFDIGYNSYTSSLYFEGNISNVAVFDEAISDAQVQEIHQRGWVDTNDSGLVSYYPLAGDYNDYKGSNDGTNNGTVFEKDLDRPIGEFPITEGNLLDFDGSNDIITVPDSSTLSNSEFTIGGRFKLQDDSSSRILVSKYLSSTGNREYSLYINTDDTVRLALGDSSGNFACTFTSTETIDFSVFENIIVSYDTGTQVCKMWLNGQPLTVSLVSGTAPTSILDSSRILEVMSRDGSYTEGIALNVFYYSDILTDDEALEFLTGVLPSDNQELYLKLDEGTGTTVMDSSGNSNDGTISGASWTTGTRPPIFNGTNGTQQTIDISALGDQETFFYRTFFEGQGVNTFALDEITLEYLLDSGRVILMRRRF